MLYWKIYPDLGVDLVATLEVLANVVLLLLNRVQFFRSVDIDPADGLPQKGGALGGYERGAYVLVLSSLPNS